MQNIYFLMIEEAYGWALKKYSLPQLIPSLLPENHRITEW